MISDLCFSKGTFLFFVSSFLFLQLFTLFVFLLSPLERTLVSKCFPFASFRFFVIQDFVIRYFKERICDI